MQKHKVVKGRQVYRSRDKKRFYTWDSLHGEIEVFDKDGYHLGALDGVTGELVKDAVRGRTLEIA